MFDTNRVQRPEGHGLPAWALSVITHAAVLVVLGLAIRPGEPQGMPESERSVRIAAFRRAAPEPQYFIDSAEEQMDAEARTAASAAGTADAQLDALTPLPSQMAPAAVRPELDLPLPGQAEAELRAALPNVGSGERSREFARKTDYSKWVQQEAARIAASKPAGPLAEIQLFGGAPSSGRTFVFLLDRSKSMGSGGLNALAAAERELGVVLRALQPVHRFAVLAYHHEVVYLDQPRLLPATETNKGRLEKFFSGIAAFGQTEHELGIRAALAMAPDVVYVFTDSGEPHPSEIILQRMIKQARQQGTTVHAIHFGFGEPRDDGGFLRRLAEETGGGYTYVAL